jgi:hypothetical protein
MDPFQEAIASAFSADSSMHHHHHHHHQITKLSHSINAIGPAPHRSGRKREHRSIVFATITHIPSSMQSQP